MDRIIVGLIKCMAMYIRYDPYADAFWIDDTYVLVPNEKQWDDTILFQHGTTIIVVQYVLLYSHIVYMYWKLFVNDNNNYATVNVLHLPQAIEAVDIMVSFGPCQSVRSLDRNSNVQRSWSRVWKIITPGIQIQTWNAMIVLRIPNPCLKCHDRTMDVFKIYVWNAVITPGN